MKASPLRLTAALAVVLLIFAAGFLLGGRYASVRAAREANAASLVWFSGIHDALGRQNFAFAAQITNTAVDGHVGALSGLKDHPWMAAEFYTLPWTPDLGIFSTSLSRVHKSYDAQPEQLRPETRQFLAAQR